MEKILIYPHKILSQKAEPVTEMNKELDDLVDQLLETMFVAKGLGLAANQIGVLKRVAVIDTAFVKDGPDSMVLINPYVVDLKEGNATNNEGCLSIPSYEAPIPRALKIHLGAYDRDGEFFEIEAEGLLARCIQHEVDHLNGVCFVDRMSYVRKILFRKQWQKRMKNERQRHMV
jgi:peptide deformylase